MSHDALIQPLKEWLVTEALGNPDIVKMFETMCIRLEAIGIPVKRARLVWQTLHPLFRAEQVVWNDGQPAELETFEHRDNATDAWMRSPMRLVTQSGLSIFRRQLFGDNQILDYPILDELKAAGFTDYIILSTELRHMMTNDDEGMKGTAGIIMTWATDRSTGFSSDDLAALQGVQRFFALAAKTAILGRISSNIATTYLGQRAGGSVLAGNIRRGDGHDISAVIWFSDMRNSTQAAENLPSESYFSLLNSYFESTAGPVMAHGGEVLDFIGDAVLGIFPYEDETSMRSAAERANAALIDSIAAAEAANQNRLSAGLERFHHGVGIHAGNVKFGNIGIPQRLAFSVIGQAVNQAARIETMTKYLQQPVLASGQVASLFPDRWRTVGSHKLEGLLDPVELYSFVA